MARSLFFILSFLISTERKEKSIENQTNSALNLAGSEVYSMDRNMYNYARLSRRCPGLGGDKVFAGKCCVRAD